MIQPSMLSSAGRAVLQEVTRGVLVRRSFLARLQEDAETVADLPDFDEVAAPYGADMPDPSEGDIAP